MTSEDENGPDRELRLPNREDSEPSPQLRCLLAVPVRQGQEELIALRDPLGVAPRDAVKGSTIVLTRPLWEAARRFDGKRTPAQLAADPELGELGELDETAIRRLAEALSARLLLEDERYREAHRQHLDAFRALPARPAVGGGREYESDVTDLRLRVGGLVANDWDMPEVEVRGLITPATDFASAARLYSRSYAALRKRGGECARVLLLGTPRARLSRLLVPMTRSFETPFGELARDAEGIAALATMPGPEELAHRDELALERQALFLRLLFPRLPVLPLLVGVLPDELPGRDSPAGMSVVEEALEALSRVLALPGETLIIAAADLARSSPLDIGAGQAPTSIGSVRALDADQSDLATRVEPEEYWRCGQREPNAERAANMVAPYLLLRLLKALNAEREAQQAWRGSVLGYEQMSRAGETVTAATIAFH